MSWVNWALAAENQSTIEFVKKLNSLRRECPVLRRNRFLTGEYNEKLGVKDVTWIHPSGIEMNDETWRDAGLRSIGMLIDGRAQTTGIRERGSDNTVLILFNGHHEPINFVMPPTVEGDGWRLRLDTSSQLQADRVFRPGETRETPERSVSVFLMY